MVLHLFPKTQFTEEYIGFVNAHFDRNEHLFVLYTNKEFHLNSVVYENENVYDYENYSKKWLINQMRRAEGIVLHNLGLDIRELAILFLFPSICKKCMWLVWGGDLYCYRDKRTGLIEKAVEYVRRKVIQMFPIIATLTDGDYDLAVKWYGVKAKHIRLDYCEEYTIELMRRLKESHIKADNVTRIIVGNSASRSNEHIEVLDMLEHIKDNDILVYVPLSYGDNEYAKEIVEYGKNVFGAKFIPITEYMSRDEYYKLLIDMDVGIYNNNRQQGTGNIEALLFFDKKIYIRDDTTMWSEWVEKEGYILHRIGELQNASVLDIVRKSEKELLTNRALIYEYFDVQNRISEWEKAFDLLLDRV